MKKRPKEGERDKKGRQKERERQKEGERERHGERGRERDRYERVKNVDVYKMFWVTVDLLEGIFEVSELNNKEET